MGFHEKKLCGTEQKLKGFKNHETSAQKLSLMSNIQKTHVFPVIFMSGKQPEIISGLAILKTGENLDHPYFVWEQTHESSEQQVWFWL